MNKQIDSGAAPLALAKAVRRWDYDKSIEKMRPLIRQWKKATVEMLRELYLAREFLTNQKGQHKDPEADNYIVYSWSGYCGELGLTYQTANNWLRPFTPRELSETGKDAFLLEPPMKTESTADLALMDARIEKALRAGKRPADWTDKEEAELKRRLENARFQQLAEQYNMPAVAKTHTDYFTETLRRSKDIINFKLTDHNQILAQASVFDHAEAYLNTFKDPETKAQAAFNLALKTKNLANEIAEKNFHLREAAWDEDAKNDS